MFDLFMFISCVSFVGAMTGMSMWILEGDIGFFILCAALYLELINWTVLKWWWDG